MCCPLVSNHIAQPVVFAPALFTMGLSKAQTFVPILGVAPAALTLVSALISLVIAIVTRFFAKPDAKDTCSKGIQSSIIFLGYSILNIASVGMFAPIHEYVKEWFSTTSGKKESTAGFFDIFPTLRKGEQIKFL